MSNVTEMKRLAYEIRIHVLDMLAEHSHGHVGGSLSIADAIAVLYAGVLRHDPKNPRGVPAGEYRRGGRIVITWYCPRGTVGRHCIRRLRCAAFSRWTGCIRSTTWVRIFPAMWIKI